MKKIATAALLALIIFSAILVHQTNIASHASPAQPVHNINTGLNYTNIQAAIDPPETLNGHTIVCDAGNYTENVHVYKSLNIIGAGPALSWNIPAEPNDTIEVTANNVTIEGFTIQSVTGYSAIRLNNADNCSVSSNTIIGAGGGITLSGSSDNTLSGNELDALPGNGINLWDYSQQNEVANNVLNRNHYGIWVRNASNYNVIVDNFVNSSDYDGIRLNWQGSNYAPVTFNSIANNIVSHNSGGIFLDNPSTNNSVSSNNVHDNNEGIRLRQATQNTILHNTITSNSFRGISAESSNDNLIADNFLYNTNNAWDDGVNRWNMTKTCMISDPNIIGGPYTAGNYWSDNPNPVDTNHDGLGEVPYNVSGGTNMDNLPLVNETQSIVKIANPQRDTWYRITRPIYANGTIGPVDPLIVDLEAIGISPGGSYNWTVSAVDTCFGEPSLVNVTWLSPEKISLTWNPPNSTDSTEWSHWPYPTPLPSCLPPWPPLPWPFPLFFSWSVLNITCEYTAPGMSPVTDSFHVIVEYGLASEPSVETLTCGETIVGMSQSIDLASKWNVGLIWDSCATSEDANPQFLGCGKTCTVIGTILGIASLIVLACACPPINSYMDLNQSATYMRTWSIINRTVALPPADTSYHAACNNFVETAIDVDDMLEALRVTYYRGCWAERVGDEDAIRLQQFNWKEFFMKYLQCSKLMRAASYTYSDQLKKIGDIYISPSNVSDFQEDLWTEGFSTNATEIFNLFGINSYYVEQEKQLLCMFSPERLSGNLSSIINNFADEIQDGDQKLTSIVFAQDNAVMDVTPFKTVVGQGCSANINVTVYCGIPAEPFNITLYANQTIIGTLTNVTFACGNCTTITFPWNTTGFAYGNYTISAYAWPVPDETDTSDNNCTCGPITVSIIGDITGGTSNLLDFVPDGKVDMRDIGVVARFFGQNVPPAPSNCDITGPTLGVPDGKIDMRDIGLAARHFGQHYP